MFLPLAFLSQVDFDHSDRSVLAVAVLQAVDQLPPHTAEASVMTGPTCVGDHFSPELIRSLTAADSELSGIIDLLVTPRPESEKTKRRAKLKKIWLPVLPSLHSDNGLLFLDERLILPHCSRVPILQLLHSTHAGARAMMSMAEFVWFPNMVREIHFVTRSCPACTSTEKNLSSPCARDNSATRTPVSLEELELDFWGPLSNNPSSQLYVLVAIDRYSRFPFALCVPGPTSDAVVRFLRQFIPLFGVPSSLRSDQGSAFTPFANALVLAAYPAGLPFYSVPLFCPFSKIYGLAATESLTAHPTPYCLFAPLVPVSLT